MKILKVDVKREVEKMKAEKLKVIEIKKGMQPDRSTVNEGPKLNLKSLILKVLSSSEDKGCLGGDFETSIADLSCLEGDLVMQVSTM